MKKLACLTMLAAITATGLAPTLAQAADTNAAVTPMERISVIYRTPFDYALYQYTTELLALYLQEVEADIYTQARSASMQMVQDQGIMLSNLENESPQINSTELTRVLKSPQ